MQEAIWKEIENYEDYQVSTLGEVRSSKWGRTKEMKLANDRDGYLYLTLCKDGKWVKKNVHRLVAQAFIPNPDNLPCVRHKDDNPGNNHVSNLRWGTHKDNMNDRDNKNRQAKGESSGRAKLTEKDVLEIRAADVSKRGDTVRLARKYNIAQPCITNIRNRTSWKHI